MNGSASASGGERRTWAIVAGATVAAAAAGYALFTLGRPYHQDTVLYLENVRAILRDGTAPAWFPSRIGTTWAYLPGYALLGEAGLRWTNVLAVTATLALYLPLVRRDFGRTEAWASAVTFATAPAVVLTVTHLKEDLNALALVAAALAVARPGLGIGRAALAGALYGLALLCKEFPLLLAPFLAGHLWLAAARPDAWRDLVRPPALRRAAAALLAFAVAALAAALALSPGFLRAFGSVTQGATPLEFLGVSALWTPVPWGAWREGALHAAALPVFLGVAVTAGALRAQPRTVLWAASAAIVTGALALTTGTRGRVFAPAFFLLLPPAWRGVRVALELLAGAARLRAAPAAAAWATAAAALALAAWQVVDLAPTLAYRRAYPPQASMFEGLGAAAPPDAVLYGTDSCTLAAYFAARPCRSPAPHPDAAAARAFIDGLVAEARRRPVLLLHDFASYDGAGALQRELSARARLDVAFYGLGEDFHEMAWAVPVDEDAVRVERAMPACRRARSEAEPLPGAPPGFEWGRTVFRCGDEERVRTYVAWRGHVTSLEQLEVLQVIPR